MRKDLVLIGAWDGMERARHFARLLGAEDWRVSIAHGASGAERIEACADALKLVVLTPEATTSPFVDQWIEATPREQLAVLAFVDTLPDALVGAVSFDFRGWRGDRAQLWRSMLRWLEAPHARLDTRIWLKRA